MKWYYLRISASKCPKHYVKRRKRKTIAEFFTPNERNKRGKIMRDHDDDAFNLSGMCSNRPSLK